MTYIPDTRQKYETPEFNNTQGASKEKAKENAYWQGYLNEADAVWVDGYDFCTNTIDILFYNLDVYKEIFTQALRCDISKIDENVLHSDDKFLSDYSDKEIAQMSFETKLFRALREILADWGETTRDEMVVSCIDNMDEAEYADIVEQEKAGKYKNILIRRIEDDAEGENSADGAENL